MSLGTVFCTSASRSFTRLDVASTLAFDCGMIAMERLMAPFERDRLRSSSAARQHFGDFAEPHQIAVRATADDEIAEIFFGAQVRVGAQREFAFARFEAARRQLHVFAQQRILDVSRR